MSLALSFGSDDSQKSEFLFFLFQWAERRQTWRHTCSLPPCQSLPEIVTLPQGQQVLPEEEGSGMVVHWGGSSAQREGRVIAPKAELCDTSDFWTQAGMGQQALRPPLLDHPPLGSSPSWAPLSSNFPHRRYHADTPLVQPCQGAAAGQKPNPALLHPLFVLDALGCSAFARVQWLKHFPALSGEPALHRLGREVQ